MNPLTIDPDQILRNFKQDSSATQKAIFSNWFQSRISQLDDTSDVKENILDQSLKYFFPYKFLIDLPFDIPDLSIAVDILKKAATQDKEPTILFFADRDADGITASSILYLYITTVLKFNRENIVILFPGENDKYGITDAAVERIIDKKPDILVTIDNGSSNKDSIAKIISELPEIQTIILDHHFLPDSEDDYPQVDAFVNPMRLGVGHNKAGLCSAGIAYMVVWAMTYAYTSEYNQHCLLEADGKSLVIKNGQVISDENFTEGKRFYLNDSEINENDSDSFDLNKLWQQFVASNRELYSVNKFLEQEEWTLSPIRKFSIIKNVSMEKIRKTVSAFLPLAAIGTVADSMELVNDNRVIVSEGLKIMRNNVSSLYSGLRQMLKVMSLLGTPVSAKDLAFSMGPLINAAGRMGVPEMGFDSIVEKDPLEAARKAYELKKQNEKRKALSLSAIQTLESQVPQPTLPPLLVLYDESIHRGISGLVASKFADKYNTPTLVLVNDGDCLRGSIRAANGENVLSLIKALEHHVIQYGGHIPAAGFSLAYDKKDKFIEEIQNLSKESLSTEQTISIPSDIMSRAIMLTDKEIQPSLWQELLIFEPYGKGNPHPVILLDVIGGVNFQYMGKDKNHIKLSFETVDSPLIEGVWFHSGDQSKVFESLSQYYLLVEPHMNTFLGKLKYQLQITGAYLKADIKTS